MAISKNKNYPNFFLRCTKSSHISFYFKTMFSKLPKKTKFSIYSATFVDLSKIAQSGHTCSKIIETWSRGPSAKKHWLRPFRQTRRRFNQKYEFLMIRLSTEIEFLSKEILSEFRPCYYICNWLQSYFCANM